MDKKTCSRHEIRVQDSVNVEVCKYIGKESGKKRTVAKKSSRKMFS